MRARDTASALLQGQNDVRCTTCESRNWLINKEMWRIEKIPKMRLHASKNRLTCSQDVAEFRAKSRTVFPKKV
jgi:hypothetical protein